MMISSPLSSISASSSLGAFLPWKTVVISEHEFALLYRQGRLIETLPTGVRHLWGRHLAVLRLDRRRQWLEIPAQELSTADGITVKVTGQIS